MIIYINSRGETSTSVYGLSYRSTTVSFGKEFHLWVDLQLQLSGSFKYREEDLYIRGRNVYLSSLKLPNLVSIEQIHFHIST